MTNHPVTRLAGALLVAGAIGFITVFSILAAQLGYPDMLDRPAGEVLPALLAGGPALRVVWAVYAALPLALAAAALLIHRAGRLHLAFTSAGVLAGLAMTAGLARWPTLMWGLAEQWDAGLRPDAAFVTLNLVLGNLVGEFLGELALATWLSGLGWALRGRWSGKATLVLAALMVVGSFRNIAPWTAAATELTNVLLPAVLLWLGTEGLLRALPGRTGVVLAMVLATPGLARAGDLPRREVMIHGFRAPSMGVELREDWVGFHLGVYPSVVDTSADGATRTTWFLKVGVTAYLYRFDTGSGRPSAPYVSVSLLQGLNNEFDVGKDLARGTAVMGEAGFRWAAWSGLDLRLGAAILVSFDGRIRFNPTPGLSWSVAF